MSGILRLESLTKGNTLRQGDLTLLKYRLFDADGDKLDISGKPATVRLMKNNFTFIAYEKEGLIVAPNDTISFSVNKILPAGLYHLEVIVDDKYIFPSRDDEGKLNVDKSSLGADVTIVEATGVEAVARKATGMMKQDEEFIDDLIENVISDTNVGNIEEYYNQFNEATTEFESFKTQALNSVTKSDKAIADSASAKSIAQGIDAKATNALSLSESADTLSKSVQEQFNQVVIDGDSSVESAQARVNTDGVTKATLKERLDDEHNEVTAQLTQTSKYIKNVQFNTASDIENYINTVPDGSLITFPENVTFLIDRQIAVINKKNLTINFNGCTLKYKDNVQLTPRTVEGYYAALNILCFGGCENIEFRNLTLDGNRHNNDNSVGICGITFENTKNAKGINFFIKSFNDKYITIRSGSTNIDFEYLNMSDKAYFYHGAYIFSSTIGGFYSMKNVTVKGTYPENDSNQFLYSAGGEWNIENVDVEKIYSVFDLRQGVARINNVNVNKCAMIAITQPYQERPEDPYPYIYGRNWVVKNCDGIKAGSQGLFIVSGGMNLENFKLYMTKESEFAVTGISINNSNDTYKTAPSFFKNVEIYNASSYGFLLDKVDSDVSIEDCKIHRDVPTSSPAIFLQPTYTGTLTLIDTQQNNYHDLVSNNDKLIRVDSTTARNVGTTEQRPLFQNYRYEGFSYYDTTLKKPIWWNGLSWVDANGVNV